jgi:hypothetical protein
MPLEVPPALWVPPKPAIIRPADLREDLRQVRMQNLLASFMPGMFPMGAARQEPAPPAGVTLAFRSSSVSTTNAVSAPSGNTAGDLLVYIDSASSFQIPSGPIPGSVTPSGFTLAASHTLASGANGYRQNISYKVATGSEGSITGMAGATTNHKIMLCFEGPISTAAHATFNGQGSTANPTAQNVTASGGTPPLVVIGAYRANGAVDPRTMSPAKDGEVTTTGLLYGAYKIYNSSPADVSVDMDDEGDNILQSGYIYVT